MKPQIVGALSAAFATLACTPLASGNQAASAARLTEDRVAQLQTEARAACRCERSAGAPGRCWAGYEAAIKDLKDEGTSVSACIPETTVQELSDGAGKHAFVVLREGVPGGMTCSPEETRYVMNAYNAALGDGDDMAAGDAAAAKAIAALKAGQSPRIMAKVGDDCG